MEMKINSFCEFFHLSMIYNPDLSYRSLFSQHGFSLKKDVEIHDSPYFFHAERLLNTQISRVLFQFKHLDTV